VIQAGGITDDAAVGANLFGAVRFFVVGFSVTLNLYSGQINVRHALSISPKNIIPAVAVDVHFIAEGVLF
jgi:hypothetical protein